MFSCGPDWFYLSGTGLPRFNLETKPLSGCSRPSSSSSSYAVCDHRHEVRPYLVDSKSVAKVGAEAIPFHSILFESDHEGPYTYT